MKRMRFSTLFHNQFKAVLIGLLFLSLPAMGQVTFQQHLISGQTHGIQSLYACDMDADGDADIIGAAAEDSDVIYWRNEGGYPVVFTKIIIDGNFLGAGTNYATDIDGDGDKDIVAGAKTGDQVAWWENNGSNPETWPKHLIAAGYDFPHEVFASDINLDGDTDVLAASSLENEITLWINEGGTPITWTRQTITTGFTQAKSVNVGDLNGDGLPDVVGASLLNNQFIWWENDGEIPINWTDHIVTSSFAGAHRVQAVDLDQDGLIDILGTGWYANQIAWWKNLGGNPPAWEKQVIASGFLRTCMGYAVDLDQDADLDVVGTAQDGDEVAWFRNDGGNPITWTKITIDPNFDRVWPVMVADFDGDTDMDVVAASGHEGNNQVRLYENLLITGIPNEQCYDANHLKINPNPCHDKIKMTFHVSAIGTAKLELYKSTGEIVSSQILIIEKTGTQQHTLDISCYPSGIYILRLISPMKLGSVKLIILN